MSNKATVSAQVSLTRQRYFNHSLLPNLPIVGIQEGNAAIIVKEDERVPTFSTVVPPSSSSTSSTTSSDPLEKIDLRTFRISSSFLCTTCRIAFETAQELRSHCKSGWHVHNMRLSSDQSSSEADILSEEAYVEMQEANEAKTRAEDSASSGTSSSEGDDDESGSEDSVSAKKHKVDDDEEIVVGSNRLTFYTPTQKVSVWKSVLVDGENPPSHLPLAMKSFAYVSALRTLPTLTRIVVLMVSGGRFSGAIFQNDQMIAHKNFQRYTTRRKQGGSQSSFDQKNGQARSIGSTIRRKETVRFQEETLKILGEWQPLIQAAHLIFIFAPANNRLLLMKALDKNDKRVRNVPFPTYRPTLEEVKRIHTTLTTIEWEDRKNPPFDLENQVAVPAGATSTSSNKSQSSNSASTSSAAAVTSPAPVVSAQSLLPQDVLDDQLLNAVRAGDLVQTQQLVTAQYQRSFHAGQERYKPLLYEAVKALATTKEGSEAETQRTALVQYLLFDSHLPEVDVDEKVLDLDEATSKKDSSSSRREIICQSALHIAALANKQNAIEMLLTAGANPTLRDSRNRLPLPLISSNSVRTSLRKFVGSDEKLLNKGEEASPEWSWEDDAEFLPITPEAGQAAEEAKKAKAKEKKKAQAARAKERKAADAAAAASAEAKAKEIALKENQAAAIKQSAQMVKEVTAARAATMSSMSDREKRAMAAERRLGASTGTAAKCTLCQNPLVKAPFERLAFKYCSIVCLQQHKSELDAKASVSSSAAASKTATFNPK